MRTLYQAINTKTLELISVDVPANTLDMRRFLAESEIWVARRNPEGTYEINPEFYGHPAAYLYCLIHLATEDESLNLHVFVDGEEWLLGNYINDFMILLAPTLPINTFDLESAESELSETEIIINCKPFEYHVLSHGEVLVDEAYDSPINSGDASIIVAMCHAAMNDKLQDLCGITHTAIKNELLAVLKLIGFNENSGPTDFDFLRTMAN